MVDLTKRPMFGDCVLGSIDDEDWQMEEILIKGMRAPLPDWAAIWEGLKANNLLSFARMLRERL